METQVKTKLHFPWGKSEQDHQEAVFLAVLH